MEIALFLFSVYAFNFSKFYKNQVEHDKGNFKRGMDVALEIKNA